MARRSTRLYFHAGVSPILLSYDGQVVASEIMASQQHVKDLGATEANPFTKPYPQQDKYMTNGFHPTSTWSYKTDDGRVQLGLVLSEAPEQASCEDVRLRVRLNFDPRHAIDARSPARHRRDSRAGRGLAQDRRAGQGLHLGRDADAHPRVLRVQLSTPDPGHHACP